MEEALDIDMELFLSERKCLLKNIKWVLYKFTETDLVKNLTWSHNVNYSTAGCSMYEISL